jgi:hypothetical protein
MNAPEEIAEVSGQERFLAGFLSAGNERFAPATSITHRHPADYLA